MSIKPEDFQIPSHFGIGRAIRQRIILVLSFFILTERLLGHHSNPRTQLQRAQLSAWGCVDGFRRLYPMYRCEYGGSESVATVSCNNEFVYRRFKEISLRLNVLCEGKIACIYSL